VAPHFRGNRRSQPAYSWIFTSGERQYLALPEGRYISYFGQWVPRSHGPRPGRPPSGGRQNGAYIWLNNPDNYESNGNPKWKFTAEINVWNFHTGGPPPDVSEVLPDYSDGGNIYSVTYRWHPVGFQAFYFNIHTQRASMDINIKALLNHLLAYSSKIDGAQHVISIDVAAEGIEQADGKFIANIRRMGRP